jgi:hypothetical protein
LAGAQALSLPELLDVDADSFASLTGGMTLYYNASIGKWQATNTLTPGNVQDLVINGGTF